MKTSGFSLIELLVTVAILAILVGVGVPLYAHYAEQAACRADEAQVTLIWRTASMMAQERGEMPEELRIDPHHPEDMTLTAADGEPLTGLASAVADSIGPCVFQSKQYTSLPLGTYLVFDGSELGTEEETEETEEPSASITILYNDDVEDWVREAVQLLFNNDSESLLRHDQEVIFEFFDQELRSARISGGGSILPALKEHGHVSDDMRFVHQDRNTFRITATYQEGIKSIT